MIKIGIIGHVSKNHKSVNGQTIKTKTIIDSLVEEYGASQVKIVSTSNWKKKNFLLLVQILCLIILSKNIIIMPANSGIKIIPKIVVIFGKFFNKKLHYIVIGGWLPEYVKLNIKSSKYLRKFHYIYVETYEMKLLLANIGFDNIVYMPNFKRIEPLKFEELQMNYFPPYNLCFFSRIIREKGIFDAIDAVRKVNDYHKSVLFKLDIYGPIDNEILNEFENVIRGKEEYISYNGIVNYEKTQLYIKNYLYLLFPTYYQGEGFPGTLIDAFFSGVPVIASNWKYNSEIVKNRYSGFIYDRNNRELCDVLVESVADMDLISEMKKNCISEANKFTAKSVIATLTERLI